MIELVKEEIKAEMDTSRKIAVSVGVLFVIATVFNLVGAVMLVNPILNDSDYLVVLAQHDGRIELGVLLIVIAALASAGIAIGLYPVLSKRNEPLALGAVGFRVIEAMCYIVAAIAVVSLLTLSHQYTDSGFSDASYSQVLGAVAVSAHDWAGRVFAVIAFGTGALMYYWVFFETRLIPRWLSGWGLVAIILLLASVLLVMFGVIGSFSTTQIVLALPIAVQEMVLAAWLIIKGFASPTHRSIGSESTAAD